MRKSRRKRRAKLIYIKFVFLVVLAIIAISLVKNSIAKYRSSATSAADVDLAFYLFTDTDISQSLQLASILPRSTPLNILFL